MSGDPVVLFGRQIDVGEVPLVVAELSANHRQDLQTAIDSVRVAAESGADVVKFQHFSTNSITVRGEHKDLRIGQDGLWSGRILADLYDEAFMPWEWTSTLSSVAKDHGISWFSSPFDRMAIDFLVDQGVEALKIASFELVDIPLIRHAASTGLPIVISTGMASTEEIDSAVDAAHDVGNRNVILLRCNSSYPARTDELDLAAITDMRERWSLPVGLSDHTLSETSAVVATALGACMIEKHFTVDRSLGGPDAAFSLEPYQLRRLVESVNEAHSALGSVRYGPSPSELSSLQFRRSLRTLREIKKGEVITVENVGSRRPSGGLPPESLTDHIGKRVVRTLVSGAPLLASDVES